MDAGSTQFDAAAPRAGAPSPVPPRNMLGEAGLTSAQQRTRTNTLELDTLQQNPLPTELVDEPIQLHWMKQPDIDMASLLGEGVTVCGLWMARTRAPRALSPAAAPASCT